MMITLSFLVVGLCFFLHRKFKKDPGAVALHTLPWTDENLEVFTLSGQVRILSEIKRKKSHLKKKKVKSLLMIHQGNENHIDFPRLFSKVFNVMRYRILIFTNKTSRYIFKKWARQTKSD